MTNTTSNIIETLRKGITQIQFEKEDGTIRTMQATLAPQYVSEDEAKSAERGNGVVNVFDTEKGAWRSFNMNRLVSYTEINA